MENSPCGNPRQAQNGPLGNACILSNSKYYTKTMDKLSNLESSLRAVGGHATQKRHSYETIQQR